MGKAPDASWTHGDCLIGKPCASDLRQSPGAAGDLRNLPADFYCGTAVCHRTEYK